MGIYPISSLKKGVFPISAAVKKGVYPSKPIHTLDIWESPPGNISLHAIALSCILWVSNQLFYTIGKKGVHYC